MKKRKSRSKKDDTDDEPGISSSTNKGPSKKRVARKRKGKGDEEEQVEDIPIVSQESDHPSNTSSDDAVVVLSSPLTSITDDADVDDDDDDEVVILGNKEDSKEDKKVKKLTASNRNPMPSPSAMRTPLHSRAGVVGFSPLSLSAYPSVVDDDGTTRKLNFNWKDAPTPGRQDMLQRGMSSRGQPLQIYGRIRPMSNEEKDQMFMEGRDDPDCIVPEGDRGIACTAPKDSHCYATGETSAKFTFSLVFGPSSTQAEVFNATTLPLVTESVSKGQNALIFAYGMTNSGKTYTMMGKEREGREGIIPRVIDTVFQQIDKQCNDDETTLTNSQTEGVIQTQTDQTDAEALSAAFPPIASPNDNNSVIQCVPLPSHLFVKVSFLEIYNEQVFDLLTSSKRKLAKCEIQNTKMDGGGEGEVFVKGLKEVDVKNPREASVLLQQGQAQRQVAKTALNHDSSRSHSVFCVKLVDENGHVWCRLSIVDLAGSERTNRTNTTAGDSRRKEANTINQSLVVLGRCLENLRYNQAFPQRAQRQIPYRESQITRLFRDSLSGWGRTVMICNVSMLHADYDESIHALKYAAVASEIKVVSKIDTHMDMKELRRKQKEKQQQEAMVLLNSQADEDGSTDSSDDATRSTQAPYSTALAEEEREQFLDQIFALKQNIVSLESMCVQREQAVREECTIELDHQAAIMEELNKQQMIQEQERVKRVMMATMNVKTKELEDRLTELTQTIVTLESQLQTAGGGQQQQQQQIESEKQRWSVLLAQRETEEREKTDTLTRQYEQRLQEQVKLVAQTQQSFLSTQQALTVALQQAKQQDVIHEQERMGWKTQIQELQTQLTQLQTQIQQHTTAIETYKKEADNRDKQDKQREKEWAKERKEWEKEKQKQEKSHNEARNTMEKEYQQQEAASIKEQEAKQQQQIQKLRAEFAQEKEVWENEKQAAWKHQQQQQEAKVNALETLLREQENKYASVCKEKEEQDKQVVEIMNQVQAVDLWRVEYYGKPKGDTLTNVAFIQHMKQKFHNHKSHKPAASGTAAPATIATATASASVPTTSASGGATASSSSASASPSTSPTVLPVAAPAIPPVPLSLAKSILKYSKKEVAKPTPVTVRESLSGELLDQLDTRLIAQTLRNQAATVSTATAGGAATQKKGKGAVAAAASVLESGKFNNSKTAPASSLHHALNESKSLALLVQPNNSVFDFPPNEPSSPSHHRGLPPTPFLSPKLQSVLAKPKKRKGGKENDQPPTTTTSASSTKESSKGEVSTHPSLPTIHPAPSVGATPVAKRTRNASKAV